MIANVFSLKPYHSPDVNTIKIVNAYIFPFSLDKPRKKHLSVYQPKIECIVLLFSIPNLHKISWTLIMTNYTLAYSDADEIFTLPLYSCYSLGAVKSFRV